MQITIIAVGKLKESYFRDALAEYSKRLGRYCKLQIFEVEDEKTPERISDIEEQKIKEREGIRIQKRLKEGSYVIALALEGTSFDSIGWSKKLQNLSVEGKSHITFVVGGSLGLDKQILEKADLLLSFSRMTFPHQLMRVILLEQLYRSFRIIKGEPYHK